MGAAFAFRPCEFASYGLVSDVVFRVSDLRRHGVALALPGVAARIFGPLSDAEVNVDMIVQNISADGQVTDVTFTVPKGDLDRVVEILKKVSLQ